MAAINLNWEAIEKAGADHYYIADAMDRAGGCAEEIMEVLERLFKTGNMNDPQIKETLEGIEIK